MTAKTGLGEILSAFEFMDQEAVELGLQHLHGVRDPFDARYKFYVLIETTGSNEKHDQLSFSSGPTPTACSFPLLLPLYAA